MSNDIDLIDELSIPTQERPDTPSSSAVPSSQPSVNSEDFEVVSEENSQSFAESYPAPLKEERTTTPKESAESIISMLDLAITSTTMPIMAKKLKKKFGAELYDKAIEAQIKEINFPDKLTDAEKTLIAKFKKFEHLLEKMKTEIPFSQMEKDQLLPVTERLCEKNGIEVSENVAFGVHLLKVVSTRVIDIVML